MELATVLVIDELEEQHLRLREIGEPPFFPLMAGGASACVRLTITAESINESNVRTTIATLGCEFNISHRVNSFSLTLLSSL